MSTVAESYVARIDPVEHMPTAQGWLLREWVTNPTESPKCRREGHLWSESHPRSLMPTRDGVTTRICTRCAKRGAYVFLTEHERDPEAERKQREQGAQRLRDGAERLIARADALSGGRA